MFSNLPKTKKNQNEETDDTLEDDVQADGCDEGADPTLVRLGLLSQGIGGDVLIVDFEWEGRGTFEIWEIDLMAVECVCPGRQSTILKATYLSHA